MRIFVTSDTHGQIQRAVDIIKEIGNVDIVIHCGDYGDDGIRIGNDTGLPTYCVKGNCDGGFKTDLKTPVIEDTKIAIVHGHSYFVNGGIDRLYYLAQEQQAQIICFGHTHKPLCYFENQIWYINPGSLTEPRDMTTGSFAIIDLESSEVDETSDKEGLSTGVAQSATKKIIKPQIVYWKDFPLWLKNEQQNSQIVTREEKPSKKVRTGKLRSLLNYSDRF